MKRWIGLLTLLAVTVPGWAQSEAEKLLATVSAKANASMGLVKATLESDLGKDDLAVQALCVAVDEQGRAVLMTVGMSSRVTAEKLKNLRVISPADAVGDPGVPAELLGIDAETGLAFLRTQATRKWSPIHFPRSVELKSGQMVAAAGLMPADASRTVYLGLAYVSGVFEVPGQVALVTGGDLTAPGSPVFGADGSAIGIVGRQMYLDYLQNNRGQTLEVGLQAQQQAKFFMPAQEFAYVLERIPSEGRVRRMTWMGAVQMEAVDEATYKELEGPGVMLDQIIPDGPADKAGLKDRDIIVAVDGKPLRRMGNGALTGQHLVRAVARMNAGSELPVTYVRNKVRGTATLKLAEMPPRPDEAPTFVSPVLAVILREKVQLDQYLDKSPTARIPGLLVVDLDPRGPAAGAGLSRNDLVTSVNGQPVNTIDAMRRLLEAALKETPAKPITLLVQRGEQSQAITITPPAKR